MFFSSAVYRQIPAETISGRNHICRVACEYYFWYFREEFASAYLHLPVCICLYAVKNAERDMSRENIKTIANIKNVENIKNIEKNVQETDETVSGGRISGERIRELRSILNISAESFGRRCNISTGYLLRMEEGKYPVTAELSQRIQAEFGIPDSWLTGETDELHINRDKTAVERLEMIFRESGLSQREFCKRLGTSNATLSCIFAGKQKVTANLAMRIESTFHIGADWLLYGNEDAKEYPLSIEMIRYIKGKPELRKTIWEMMENELRENSEN